ncbi:MAG: hypothetical protein HC875_31595 [Anaerolineales bacterium]|nr:hypothetical protein [Anaerolineales bacterium]
MKQNLRFRNHSLYSLWLIMALLVSLFWAVGVAFQPTPAAAQTLPPANQISNFRAPLNTLTSPSPWLIQATSVATLYLPIIYRNPQPSFWDDFSDDDSGWPVGTDSACTSKYEGGRYQLNVNKDEECFRFAPPMKLNECMAALRYPCITATMKARMPFLAFILMAKGAMNSIFLESGPMFQPAPVPMVVNGNLDGAGLMTMKMKMT